MRARITSLRFTVTICFCFFVQLAAAQSGAPNGEWPTYGGDLGHTRYSALDQINASNFEDLEITWRFKTHNLGPNPEYRFQSTPLMIDGVIYTTAGARRTAVAVNAATGEMLWMHRIEEGERGQAAPRPLSGRGLAYWPGGDGGGVRLGDDVQRLELLSLRRHDPDQVRRVAALSAFALGATAGRSASQPLAGAPLGTF